MGKCKFRSEWLLKKDNNGHQVKSWGEKENDQDFVCKICDCAVNVHNKGFHAILQHADTAKHKQLCKDKLNPNQMQLLVCNSDSDNVSKFRLFSSKEASTSAELIWVMKCVSSNYSAASCQDIAQVFSTMFPGDISEKFTLSPKKLHYLLTDAIAPYFQSKMLNDINSALYSISFDETTNVEGKKQLQISVRYWSDATNQVVCKHLQTYFIGKADADILHSKITSALNEAHLPLSNILMLSSDGPNVNKKVHRLLNEDVLSIRPKGLVDIGTCPIHLVHNAFLKAMQELGEDAMELVIAVYYYFNGWPSRSEEYKKIQEKLDLKSHAFLKHSPTRWLTFGCAASRLIEQWEGIQHYFLKYIPMKKSNKVMQSAAYKKIASLLKYSCIKAELHFAISSAELFMSFTKKFQRDEALIHILHAEISLLIQKLAGRVYKSDVLKKIDLIIAQGVNALEVKHFLPLTEIVLSTEVKEELAKIHNNNDKSKFLKDVQTHYSSACKYLIEKAHLTKLTKALRCLHPDERQKRRSCEDIITVSKSLPLDVQDDILLDQWKLLQLETENPDSKITRIEHFWNQFFSRCDSLGTPKFDVVSKVIKAALSLYHGNADIERRFSVSRWALTEDKSSMSERTLNAILITKDAVKQYGSPNLVPITKELITSAHYAHRNYQLYLEDVKQKKEAEQKKSEEEERLKKELLDKQKQTEDAKKDIQAKEVDLKKKMKDHESTKETVDTLFKEATERLEKAIKNGDMKEVKLAHAMLEGVSKMKEIEEMKCKEVKSLTQSIQKRKSNVISSFMYKKPKYQNK